MDVAAITRLKPALVRLQGRSIFPVRMRLRRHLRHQLRPQLLPHLLPQLLTPVSVIGQRRKAVKTSAMMVQSAMTTAAEELQLLILTLILVRVVGLRSKVVKTSVMMVQCAMTSAVEGLPHQNLLQ